MKVDRGEKLTAKVQSFFYFRVLQNWQNPLIDISSKYDKDTDEIFSHNSLPAYANGICFGNKGK